MSDTTVVFPRPGSGDRFLPDHELRRVNGWPRLHTPDTIDSVTGGEFPGVLSVGDWLDAAFGDDPHELARAAVIAAIVDRAHEALEWTRVDGDPIATAHPDGVDHEEAWAMLAEAAGDLVDRYIATWPAPTSSPTT